MVICKNYEEKKVPYTNFMLLMPSHIRLYMLCPVGAENSAAGGPEGPGDPAGSPQDPGWEPSLPTGRTANPHQQLQGRSDGPSHGQRSACKPGDLQPLHSATISFYRAER